MPLPRDRAFPVVLLRAETLRDFPSQDQESSQLDLDTQDDFFYSTDSFARRDGHFLRSSRRAMLLQHQT